MCEITVLGMATGEITSVMPRPLRSWAEFQLTRYYSFNPIEMKASDLAQQAARTTLLAQEKCLILELVHILLHW